MSMNKIAAEEALRQLLLAYAKGDCDLPNGGGTIEWEDLNTAFDWACDAMPGVYEKIVDELTKEQEAA